ncbi:hypothetical protein MKW94_001487 [Papaver nudicaule]|uniref:RING-type domain-containing protein n=1 Tax=Papaver nudicaule TaxID=74823 RepID=A0AA41W1F8_PAPNU|nr:hypothetical protein [Papaver nudicaule]
METGESSRTADESPWARLVPFDSRYSDVEISSKEMVVSSENTRSSKLKNQWCKITRSSDLCTTSVQNLSSNTITVDGKVLEKNGTMVIKCGSEIVSGPDAEGHLTYRFSLIPSPENCEKLKISVDVEHAKCCICLNIWHDVVTAAPCLHNFCNGCFSEWLRRSLEKHPRVLCPQCRGTVQFVGRNHFLHNIEEGILQTDSSLRRGSDEIALLDGCATIKSNLVISSTKRSRRKRPHSPPPTEENEAEDISCPQCGTEIGGFQCNGTTAHLQCQICAGMMPSRTNTGVPQHCLGCDRAYCGAYWLSQGVATNNSQAVCSPDTFKPISEYTISEMPALTHEYNRLEKDITGRCIRQSGKTLQDVISEMIVKFNSREIGRSRLTLNHAEMITAGTHLCKTCYDKLVAFLLFSYRVAPETTLPPDASTRGECWYGYTCRTQHHSESHARKLNHVCHPDPAKVGSPTGGRSQTRGSQTGGTSSAISRD